MKKDLKSFLIYNVKKRLMNGGAREISCFKGMLSSKSKDCGTKLNHRKLKMKICEVAPLKVALHRAVLPALSL